MSNGEPIIIKGGDSIEVLLSKDTFPADSTNADRHYTADRNIIRVIVTDDTTGAAVPVPIPVGGKFTISIEHSSK